MLWVVGGLVFLFPPAGPSWANERRVGREPTREGFVPKTLIERDFVPKTQFVRSEPPNRGLIMAGHTSRSGGQDSGDGRGAGEKQARCGSDRPHTS